MSKLRVNNIEPVSGDRVNFQGKTVNLPNVTTIERDSIAGPLDGDLVYNTDTNSIERYNSLTTSWLSVDGVQSINGNTSSIQIFDNGSTGTAPNFTQSGNNTNTLNIPNASVTGVTAGLISKTDYDSFNQRLFPVQNTKYVVKNATLGIQDFNDIQEAIDSISDASSSNPYIVRVGPGVYPGTITMKSWVWVTGAEQDQTIITATSGDHAVYGADNSGISNLLIQGASSSGKAGVFYSSLTGTTNTSFMIEGVRFGSNDTLAISDGGNAPTAIFLENCKLGSVHQFNHGFLAQNGGRVVVRNSTTTGLTSPYPDYIFKAIGSGSQIVLNGVQVRSGGITSGACIHLADGALLRALSTNIRMFGKALWIEDVGAASIVDAVGILCEANTMDIVVDHPSADGTFNGSADHTKIYINPSSTFSTVFSCNHMPSDNTGFVVVGDVLQGDRFDRLSNLSLIARKATTLGVIEDVEAPFVEVDSGLDIIVNAGTGFVNEPSELYLIQVEWEETPITLPANSTKYIYIDHESNVLTSDSPTDPESTVILGRVNTDSTTVRFIENSDLPVNHYGNKTENFFRKVLGPIWESGAIISENVSPRKLDATSGSYYFGVTNLLVSGGNAINWETFYRDGIGGWTSASGQDTVSNSEYDDGSGVLASIPTNKYVRHHLYVVGDGGNEKWFLVTAQNYYDSQAEAEDSTLPLVPPFFNDALTRVAGIVVQQGTANVISVVDLRIRPGQAAPAGTAVTAHGDLTGLLNDDHTQYLLTNGTRAMSGNLDMNSQDITNVDTINGIIPQTHASRHLPSGADPLTTAAPLANLSAITTNNDGTANSLSRSDHGHAISTGIVSSQIPDQANATGTSGNLARADHIHNIATASPIANLSATITNAQGVAATFSRSDHSHAISTGIVSTQTPDQANATGTSGNLARADHIHAIPTAAATTITTSTTNTQGAAATFARSDHTHVVNLTNTHVSATGNFTVTSGTDALVKTMTITPVAGTYMVWASCTTLVTAGGSDAVTMSIYSGGSQATGTERTHKNASGLNSQQTALAAQTVVTVNGSQAIEMRARQSGGNQTIGHRTLSILRLS